MNRLEAIGYEQKFFMDHEGKFDDYIGSLQSRVGLKPDLADQSQYRVRYTGFDGEPIFDDADVFDHWFNTISNEATTRTV